MEETLRLGSGAHLAMFGALLFSRTMDLLSTWLGTPRLILEANPFARRLGWKKAIVVNLAVSALLSLWPLPAIILCVSSVLVAARNFQSVWLMRTMGEHGYRQWMADRIREGNFKAYTACLVAQSFLVALVGLSVILFSPLNSIPFAIGAGIMAYAVVVFLFTALSIYRLRRS